MAGTFAKAFGAMPLIAILRGIAPAEAEAVGTALIEAGLTLIEVPLNSPDPFDTIERLVEVASDRALIGAGTVIAPSAVKRVARSGGRFVVSPNADDDVIKQTLRHELEPLPGAFSPTEVFTAIRAGATHVKLFPAELMPPVGIKAIKAVIPADVRLVPTGGITAASMHAYVEAGAAGFGLGSALYKPGLAPSEVAERAGALVAAWWSARPR